MKLCEDCKHFRVSIEFKDEETKLRWATCGRTARVTKDSGEPCRLERTFILGGCGKYGGHFVPKGAAE